MLQIDTKCNQVESAVYSVVIFRHGSITGVSDNVCIRLFSLDLGRSADARILSAHAPRQNPHSCKA